MGGHGTLHLGIKDLMIVIGIGIVCGDFGSCGSEK